MEQKKKNLKFEPEFLDNLLEDKNSCVEIYKNHKEHIVLQPWHMGNIKEGLMSILDVGKYNKKYNGILLAHKNVVVLPTNSIINREYVYVHLDIQADFYIFKPEVGKTLSGVINKRTPKHIGALIYNTFNASILKPETDDDWLGQQASIGEEVVLRVNFITYKDRIPFISGELISIKNSVNNTKIKFDTDSEVEDSEIKKKKRKKSLICKDNDVTEKIIDTNIECVKEQDSLLTELIFSGEKLLQDQNLDTDLLKTKKKKNKTTMLEKNFVDTETIDNSLQPYNLIITDIKKKKKKYEKESSLMVQEEFIDNSLENIDQSESSHEVKIKKKDDEVSFDLDTSLDLDNLLNNTSILSTNNLCMANDDIKVSKRRRSSMMGDVVVNIKKETLEYDTELEDALKDIDSRKKKRRRSIAEESNMKSVKNKKIKTEF